MMLFLVLLMICGMSYNDYAGLDGEQQLDASQAFELASNMVHQNDQVDLGRIVLTAQMLEQADYPTKFQVACCANPNGMVAQRFLQLVVGAELFGQTQLGAVAYICKRIEEQDTARLKVIEQVLGHDVYVMITDCNHHDLSTAPSEAFSGVDDEPEGDALGITGCTAPLGALWCVLTDFMSDLKEKAD